MRKEILLPITAWLGGVAGFALRCWELAVGYNSELQLMSTVTATKLLWGLGAVLFVVFALCCRKLDRQRSPQQWFYAPTEGYIMLMVSSAFLLMAGGGFGIWKESLATAGYLKMLAYVLFLIGGACVLMAGQAVYRGTWNKNTPLLFMAPSFAVLVWLIACYQGSAKQPEVAIYVWHMLSAIAVVLAAYTLVTLAVGRGGAGRACLFCLMGIVLSGIALADTLSGHLFGLLGGVLSDIELTALADMYTPATVLVYLFGLIYLTTQSWLLLRVDSGKAWPPRMPKEADGDEQDNTEE